MVFLLNCDMPHEVVQAAAPGADACTYSNSIRIQIGRGKL